ncbi:zinc dependent phospholipase C family protein [Anaerosacchariphilus polymeriproducens]|uniref:Phospholipase C/D domain-containing protein n=1 Tax=Anaerosacchariphilus polymeriproducens TaxID=1812858 RepID=A0A371AWM9_9FIRM|nr:zinc dependent phospholipase C family protein [Anaerosacchariphilus polymeriproducens]RDU23963.1 hypothetical protein DWV06_06620 [Anaerosacchariphilus polymeriproducens]
MPGFIMHYLYGIKCVKEFQAQYLEKDIEKHKGVFALGTQGPDLFFYHFPSKFLYEQNPGSIMHKEESGRFFLNFIRNIDIMSGEKKETAIAYLCGFLAHYSLDQYCHPYVYARTGYHGNEKGYLGRHIAFETQMDIEILKRLTGNKPSAFSQVKVIKMNLYEKKVVGDLLYKTLIQTYSNKKIHYLTALSAVYMFGWALRVIQDKNCWKKPLVGKIEKKFYGYETISAHIMNDKVDDSKLNQNDVLNLQKNKWQHPWDDSLVSDESVIELWNKSKNFYEKLMKPLEEYFFSSKESDNSYLLNTLLERIGNKSYHTGFDCGFKNYKKNIKSSKL